MPNRLRILLPAGLVLLGACGLLGDGSGDSGDGSTGPAQAPQGGASTPAAVAGDAAGAPAADAPAQTQAQTPGPAPGPAPAADQVADQQTLTTDERLDQLLANQEEITRRLDSLAASIAPGDTAAAAAGQGTGGSGQVLGQASEQVRNFGVGIVWSVIVLVVFNLIIRGLVWVLDQLAERNASRRLFFKRLVPIVRIVLWIFAAYLIVRVIFQVDYQGLVAAGAAIGVAVGFAAQDLLKHLFGGLILVFDQSFQVGDKIKIGGTYGEVVSIGLRSTRMVTPDDNLVSVPNAEVVDNQVANANAGHLHCQVVTDLFLPGWVDEAEAKRIAFDAAASSRYVFLNKPIVVLVSDVFKETFLTQVRVKAYVLDPRLEFLFQSDVTERARAGFREAGLLRPQHMRSRLVERSAAGAAASASPDPDRDAED